MSKRTKVKYDAKFEHDGAENARLRQVSTRRQKD